MSSLALSSFGMVVNNVAVGTPLVQIVVTLIVVGVILWLINRYIPMQSTIKSILNAVVVIAIVIWLLEAFGLLSGLTSYRVGR